MHNYQNSFVMFFDSKNAQIKNMLIIIIIPLKCLQYPKITISRITIFLPSYADIYYMPPWQFFLPNKFARCLHKYEWRIYLKFHHIFWATFWENQTNKMGGGVQIPPPPRYIKCAERRESALSFFPINSLVQHMIKVSSRFLFIFVKTLAFWPCFLIGLFFPQKIALLQLQKNFFDKMTILIEST